MTDENGVDQAYCGLPSRYAFLCRNTPERYAIYVVVTRPPSRVTSEQDNFSIDDKTLAKPTYHGVLVCLL